MKAREGEGGWLLGSDPVWDDTGLQFVFRTIMAADFPIRK
jgi:hypothetical protein